MVAIYKKNTELSFINFLQPKVCFFGVLFLPRAFLHTYLRSEMGPIVCNNQRLHYSGYIAYLTQRWRNATSLVQDCNALNSEWKS